MKIFSLRTVIDDILLIVRNNNISESEDLSRDQIRAWVLAYKAYLTKKQHDNDEQVGDDEDDDSLSSTIGPLELQIEPSHDECCANVKRTVNKLPDLLGDSAKDVVSVTDADGCVIQMMSQARKHYHRFRRYTRLEPSCYYENGYIYVENAPDLKYIDVTANFIENGTDDENGDEDQVTIPGWMIPDIKKAVMDNELRFMLNRPSDDSNNSTLASVKPHGPQDQEQ